MEHRTFEEFVANAALLAAHLTRQCETAAAEQADSARRLHEAADGVESKLLAGRAALLDVARAATRDAVATETAAISSTLDASAKRAHAAVAGLEHSAALLRGRGRLLGIGAFGALCIGAVGVIVGTGVLARQNLERAHQARVHADVLQALEQVTVTSCDGQPCIKLADDLRRWSGNGEYVLVDTPRPGR